MSDMKKNQIILFLTWMACMMYLLLFHYNIISLICFLGIGIYAGYLAINGVEKKVEKRLQNSYLKKTLLYLTACFVLVLLLSHIVSEEALLFLMDNKIEAVEEVVGYMIEILVENITILLFVAAVVWFIKKIMLKKHSNQSNCFVILSYAVWILYYIACINRIILQWYDSDSWILLYVLVCICFVFGDLYFKNLKEQNTKIRLNGKVWLHVCTIAWMVVLLTFIGAMNQLGISMTYHITIGELVLKVFEVQNFFVFLVIGIINIACNHIFAKNALGELEKTKKIGGLLLYVVLFTYMHVSVGYGWMLVFLYLIANALFYKMQKKQSGKRITWMWFVACLMTVVLLIRCSYGDALRVIVLCASTSIILFIGYRNYKKERERERERALLYNPVLLLITWFYVNAMAKMLTVHWNWNIVLLYSMIYLIFIVVLKCVFYNPHIYNRNVWQQLGISCMPVLFFILSCVAFYKGGSDIKITRDDSLVLISIHAQGKTNEIKSMKWHYMSDANEIAQDLVGANQDSYSMLTEEAALSAQKGLLKIIVEDKYGIQTVKTIWMK